MTINRRKFSMGMASLGSLAARPAAAQGAPVEGQHYNRLQQAQPVAQAGKVEVVEFFSYACPHCAALEPLLEAWIKRQPADVVVRRVPVYFGRPQWEYLQALYYALEVTGQLDTLHRKVFNALHTEHKMLFKDSEVMALMTANGADGAKLVDTMKSFAVQTRVRQAKQLAEAYRIEGVPTIAVQGRWTTGAEAGSHDRTLMVTDYLIGLARKSRS